MRLELGATRPLCERAATVPLVASAAIQRIAVATPTPKRAAI